MAKKITFIDSHGKVKTYASAADVPDESARKLLKATEPNTSTAPAAKKEGK